MELLKTWTYIIAQISTWQLHSGTGQPVWSHTGRPFLSFGGPVCTDRISNCPLDGVLTYKILIYLLNLQICVSVLSSALLLSACVHKSKTVHVILIIFSTRWSSSAKILPVIQPFMSLQPHMCAFEFHPFQSITKAGDTVQFYKILVLIIIAHLLFFFFFSYFFALVFCSA